ncbi:MAG: ABC transporter ATP-binding protein [Spirochaetota bacterium]
MDKVQSKKEVSKKWEPEDLILKNIVKTFDDGRGRLVQAVNDLSLTIGKGEFVTLLGPSGCGKTTTLRIVAGFESPDSGTILLGDRKMNNVPVYDRNMPMVFQSYALFPHMTIFDNIAYGLKIRKLPREVIRNDVEMSLQLVNMVGLEKRYPGELSGGQQQRVALARALVLKPKIILFDEPLSNLDAKLRIQTRMEIKRVQQMLKITALYVTHDQAEALSMSDRIVVMNKGKIEQIGKPEEIYNNPVSLFTADFMGNANFIEGIIEEITDNIVIVSLQGKSVEVAKENTCEGLKEEEEVYLVIKPEAVSISDKEPGFKAKLASSFFLGSTIEYSIEFENTFINAVQSNTDKSSINRTIGKEIMINFNRDFFHIFKK